MGTTFNPFPNVPNVPKEIENAALSGELVVFIGAGISRLVKCPSWEGFADKILEQLVPETIDYYELSQLKSISDPKKKLSIARIFAQDKKIEFNYRTIFAPEVKEPNIYSYLNKLNCAFITTNYDKFLIPQSRKFEPEERWRFYLKKDLLREKIDVNGNVIHLHGCIDDPESMIITTKDYLDHYSNLFIRDFLTYLFESKTVLFLGYGLEEIEVLEYILRRGNATNKKVIQYTRRFLLQGFFHAEKTLFEMLKRYYLEAFDAEIISFPKDYKYYSQQEDILAKWAEKLAFRRMSLIDEVDALEDEING